ncbi:hypothetical protein [Streptomyces sp. AGS-58]|uniref:hypothetical protein n=1 Tax=unclassified Streptomyces TaxID=2593676 RepID=UPI0035A2B1CE
MSSQTPSRPAYRLPDTSVLSVVVREALDDATASRERLGRVMAVVTAAAVRDILTGHRPDAPFDASAIELVEGEDSALFPSGRYWTIAGRERTFTDAVGRIRAANTQRRMTEWTAYLNDTTRDVWHPLCRELDDRDGRPAFALDLHRTAALTLGAHRPAASGKGVMVETMVSANGQDHYPALVDPTDQRDGFVRPWFDLDTVRRIAADSQDEVARYGHGSIDTVHVLDGTVDRTEHAVVLVVCWMRLGGEQREKATEILQPNVDGRYAVGGHEWCWYAVDRLLNPLIPFRPES